MVWYQRGMYGLGIGVGRWHCMVIIMVSYQRAFGFWFWEKWRRKCLNLRFHSQGSPHPVDPTAPTPNSSHVINWLIWVLQLLHCIITASLFFGGDQVFMFGCRINRTFEPANPEFGNKCQSFVLASYELNLVHLTLWMYSKLQNFQLIFFLLESLHSESLPSLPRDYIWETWHKWENSNWMLWIQLNSVVFHLRMPPLLATLCVSGPFHFAPCFIDTVHSTNLRTVHTVNTSAPCTVSLHPLLYRQGEEMHSWTSFR